MLSSKFSKSGIITLAGVMSFLIFSLNSMLFAQDDFVIGAFWAPVDTHYYSQVLDCGMNLIQQPSISEPELTAAERYGFRYVVSDSDGILLDNVALKTMR